MSDTVMVKLELTNVEANILYEKLDMLCRECFFGAGVDVWLAPGGSLNSNDKGFDDLLFLTPDPVEDTIAIDAIHTKLRDMLHINTPKEQQFLDPDTNKPVEFDVNGKPMNK